MIPFEVLLYFTNKDDKDRHSKRVRQHEHVIKCGLNEIVYYSTMSVMEEPAVNKHHNGRGAVSGVYWALFRFELPACCHPKLGIFWGVLLFQKKF